MKTKTIELYEYSELSKEAQKKALSEWNEYNDDPYMQSSMINILKERLDERGIKYNADSIDVRYSLSNCQGDGFMFIGELYWKQYTIYIKHNNGRYFHSNSAIIEMQETHNLGFHMDDDHVDVKVFERIYQAICKAMEDIGHKDIEYQTSEECFMEECEANEYTFRKDGTMENL